MKQSNIFNFYQRLLKQHQKRLTQSTYKVNTFLFQLMMEVCPAPKRFNK